MRKESAVSDQLKFPHGRDGAVPGVQQAKRLFVGVVAFEAADAAVEHKANEAAAFKDGAERCFRLAHQSHSTLASSVCSFLRSSEPKLLGNDLGGELAAGMRANRASDGHSPIKHLLNFSL
jgi:hypothetical protein